MSPVQLWMGHACQTKGPSLPAATNAVRANAPVFLCKAPLIPLGSYISRHFHLVDPHCLFRCPILWRIFFKIYYLAICAIFSQSIAPNNLDPNYWKQEPIFFFLYSWHSVTLPVCVGTTGVGIYFFFFFYCKYKLFPKYQNSLIFTAS